MIQCIGGLAKKAFVRILILLVACTFANKAFAIDNLGGEIYYKYLGGTTYRVYLNYYGDCGSGSIINTFNVQISDLYTVKTYATQVDKSSYYDANIPSGQCTSCSSGTCKFLYGAHNVVYYVDVDVSVFSGCKLQIYWDMVFWNGLTTISGTVNYLYVVSLLDRCNGDHDSPVFEEQQLLLANYNIALDQYQTVSPANKNDSVVYKLTPASSYWYSPYTYNKNYGYDHPLRYYGLSTWEKKPKGFHYDSLSGEIFFIPTHADVTLISLEADEYSKDKSGQWYLSGTTMRVNQLICAGYDSSNHNPVVEGIRGAKSDTVFTCAGIPLGLQIPSFDIDKDSVKMSDINDTKGSISYSNAKQTIATFSWNPANADVSPIPYSFILSAKDNAHPVCGSVQRRFYIYVQDSLPTVSLSHTETSCGTYHYIATVSPSSAAKKMVWYLDGKLVSTDAAPDITVPYNGTHIIHLKVVNSHGCVKDVYDTLPINELPNIVAAGGSKICIGDHAFLTANGGTTYSWSPATSLSQDTGVKVRATPQKATTYFVTGQDNKGCKAIDSVTINVDSIPVKINTDTTVCEGGLAYVQAFAPTAKSFSWVNTNGKKLSTDPVLFIKITNDTSYVLTVTDSFGCTKTIPGKVHVHVTRANAGKDVAICSGDSTQLLASAGKSYFWNAGPGLPKGSNLQDPIVKPTISTKYVVSIMDSFGCTAKDTVKVSVSSIYPITLKPSPICIGDSVQLAAFGGTNYSWQPTIGLSDPNSRTPFAKPSKSTTYYVTICDSSCGCKRLDSVILWVWDFKKLDLGGNKNVCDGISATVGDTAVPGYNYYWTSHPNGFTSQAAQNIIFPTSSATYFVREKNNQSGCTYFDSVFVHVSSTRIPAILGTDSVCNKDIVEYQDPRFDSSVSYSWKIAGGHFLSQANNRAFVTWDLAGFHSIQLNTSFQGQCPDSSTRQIWVGLHPVSKILVPGNICTGETFTIADSNTHAASYKWSFGDGGGSLLAASAYTYALAGRYRILLVMADGLCATVDSAWVNVDAAPVRKPIITHSGTRQYIFDNVDSTGLIGFWDLGDGTLAHVNNLSHIYGRGGNYKVSYHYSYAYGCDQVFDTLLLVPNEVLQPKDTVYVSPNPFLDHVDVHYANSEPGTIEIWIYDAFGRVVNHKQINDLPAGEHTSSFSSVSPFMRNGMYLLKYLAGDKITIFKLIKI